MSVCIVAEFPWGNATCYRALDEVDSAVAEYKAAGAKNVFTGREAESHLASEAKRSAIQAMADCDRIR